MCEIRNNGVIKNIATSIVAPNALAKNNETVKNNTKLFCNLEDSFDDGKISFKAKAYYFISGVFEPVVEMFKSPKNFLVGLVISAGIGVASFFAPVTPILAMLGLTSGINTLYKGIKTAKNAKTDKEAQESWKNIGLGASIAFSSLNLPKIVKKFKQPKCGVIEPKDKAILEQKLASYFNKNPKEIDPKEISEILSKISTRVTEPEFKPSDSCRFGRKQAFTVNFGKDKYRLILETHSTKKGGWVTRLYDDVVNGIWTPKENRSYIQANGQFVENVYRSPLTHLESGKIGREFVLSA